jgi:hypothetical protein
VLSISVISGPEIAALQPDPNPFRRPQPLEDIAHAEPAPDVLDVDSFALEGEARIACNPFDRDLELAVIVPAWKLDPLALGLSNTGTAAGGALCSPCPSPSARS